MANKPVSADQIFEDNFSQHEDDDHTTCASNYSVCSVCGFKKYWSGLMYGTGCNHTAASTWVPQPCDCSFAEHCKEAKRQLAEAVEWMIDATKDIYLTNDLPGMLATDDYIRGREDLRKEQHKRLVEWLGEEKE